MQMRYIIVAAALMAPVVAVAETSPVSSPKSVSCINLRDIASSEVIDNKTIIFKMRGKKYYKNELPHSCPRLGFQKSYSLRTSTTQLCSVDVIRVLENYGGGLQEGVGCGLGKFVEYTPPPKQPKS
jgi:hypothetical protein